jgi:hypothetical protein
LIDSLDSYFPKLTPPDSTDMFAADQFVELRRRTNYAVGLTHLKLDRIALFLKSDSTPVELIMKVAQALRKAKEVALLTCVMR